MVLEQLHHQTKDAMYVEDPEEGPRDQLPAMLRKRIIQEGCSFGFFELCNKSIARVTVISVEQGTNGTLPFVHYRFMPTHKTSLWHLYN